MDDDMEGMVGGGTGVQDRPYRQQDSEEDDEESAGSNEDLYN